MQRRKFSREFKLEAVKLVRERGVSCAQAARDLDVHENVLRKWVREFGADPKQAFPGLGQMKPEQLEIDRLRKEVVQAEGGAGHPKKGRSLLREGSDMRFAFVAKHRSIWPVAWLCEALDVSRSGFHAWLNRSRASGLWKTRPAAVMRQSFMASDRTYGARRVWHDVLAEGFNLWPSPDRAPDAQECHAGEAPQALSATRYRRAAWSAAIAPNVLDRQFHAPAPNRKWIADFTYIWTAEGWLYVAAVIDLFSRRVVGWSMSASMTAQLVTDALLMAIWRRGKPNALLHHSDQGSQYTSEQFRLLLADNGVTCSMSRSGNVWDNAAMESFFSSLKTERTARKDYRTQRLKPRPMCSITLSASTIPSAGIRRWGISALLSSKERLG